MSEMETMQQAEMLNNSKGEQAEKTLKTTMIEDWSLCSSKKIQSEEDQDPVLAVDLSLRICLSII